MALPLLLNSLVHVLLYSYYGLSVLYPNLTIGWKKQLTVMQIIQFGIDLVQATIGYLYYNFCVFSICYGVLMTGLFINFYVKTYLARKNQ